MSIRKTSRKAFMLEVVVAMAIATFLSSTLLVSYYKVSQEQQKALKDVQNVFLAENLFFMAVKEFLGQEAYYQHELLKEGATMTFEEGLAEWSIVGFSHTKKRAYYMATITLKKGEERVGECHLILTS